MKKMVSAFLAVVMLACTLTPMAFAESSTLQIAPFGETYLEMENYAAEGIRNDTNAAYTLATADPNSHAHGGALLNMAQKYNLPNGVTFTIPISVKVAGYYNLDWVVSPHTETTLSIGGEAIITAGVDDYAENLTIGSGGTTEYPGPSYLIYRYYKESVYLDTDDTEVTVFMNCNANNQILVYADYLKFTSASTPVVQPYGKTYVEMETLAPLAVRNDTNAEYANATSEPNDAAHGGALLNMAQKYNLPDGVSFTIPVIVEEAGYYEMDWVVSPMSPVTLSIDGETIFDSTADTYVENLTVGSGASTTYPGPHYLIYRYNKDRVYLNAGETELTVFTDCNSSNQVLVYADYLSIARSKTVNIASADTTYIELENYTDCAVRNDTNTAYTDATADVNSYAHGGALLNMAQKFNLPDGVTFTIPLVVERPGYYDLDWVVSPMSPVTLSIGGTEIFNSATDTRSDDLTIGGSGASITYPGPYYLIYRYYKGSVYLDSNDTEITVFMDGNSSNQILVYADYLKFTPGVAPGEGNQTGYKDAVSIRNDQYIWNNDITTLSATVTYQNDGSANTISALLAQYDEYDALVDVHGETRPVAASSDLSWQVSDTVHPDAVKARFFAWNTDSMKPATAACELEKLTSGEFIYVDVNSTASTANGAFATPYKTFSSARAQVRKRLANSTESEIYVVLKGGEYIPSSYSTTTLVSQDWSDDKTVIYTSLNSDRAKFTGKQVITGFSVYDSAKNIYRAAVPRGTQTRQLYVNGVKATRARSADDAISFTNLDYGATSTTFANNGLTSSHTAFLSYQYPSDLELHFGYKWVHQFVTVDTITQSIPGLVDIKFTNNQANWKAAVTGSAPATTPVYVENAYELLDEPGEWYLDTHNNYIYYMPRAFEDMQTAEVAIPGMEKLITLVGTQDAPAKNIQFRNIDFEYTTWNYPTTNRAFGNGQNATYTRSDGSSFMDGAVELFHAHNIVFDNCDFSKIGSMALKMTGAIQNCDVIGNEFYEIGGSAIQLGDVTDVDGIYVRNPQKESQLVTDVTIANNYIHKVAAEFKGTAALGFGFPKNTIVRNNDISDGAYSGIHTGWGWSSQNSAATENFVIENNFIHNFLNWRLYDGGGVYTLSNTNGTEANPNYIRGNYFQDMKNHYGAIYPDQGSAGWSICDNVIDQSNYPTGYGSLNLTQEILWLHIWQDSIRNIWLDNNYSTTLEYVEDGLNIDYVSPNYYPNANWSGGALKIIEEAGIEKEYQNRFDFRLQSLRLPTSVSVSRGATQTLSYTGISSKDRLVDLSDYEIRVTSSKPSIATATATSVTGVSRGTAWITFEYYKEDANGDIEVYDQQTFRVVVS